MLSLHNGRWQEWSGQIYVKAPRLDAAWLRTPSQLGADADPWLKGAGAVEAWVDVDRAYAMGEDPYSFYDNDNVSSYEHLHATLRWDQPWGEGWAVALAVTPRVFTPDLNPWARRELTHGFGAELRLRRQLTARGALAVGARWERWWHAFDPVAVGLRPGLGVDPSTWARAELAWEQAPRPDRVWVPWLGLSDGNGRGSDFFVDHGLEWGAGLRVHR